MILKEIKNKNGKAVLWGKTKYIQLDIFITQNPKMTSSELLYHFCYFHNQYDILQQFFYYYMYVEMEGIGFLPKNPNKSS